MIANNPEKLPLPRRKPLWQRRRVLWPAIVVLLVITVIAASLISSNTSWVVVCNNTGVAIPELTISACGQSRRFRDIEDGASVVLKLAPRGGASEVAVSLRGPKPLWHGDYIEPTGGYQAIVRLGRNGEVEYSMAISWWRHVWEITGLGH